MRRYLLSPAAQADIEEIWDYSVEKWGEDTASRYILGIRAACQSLSDGKQRGRSVGLRHGYRKLPCGSHVLYFKIDDDVVVIVRILHQAMDVDRHI